MIFRSLTDGQEGLPMVVVDLGYSRNQRSCGLASTELHGPLELTFGEAVCRTAGLVEEHGPCVLALEAVLSTYHGPDGNPDVRGAFERGRGWYYGPGVTTLAAAMRLLNELNRIGAAPVEVFLCEGFLSFKKTRTRHTDDAERILNEFWQVTPETLAPGTEPLLPFLQGVPPVRTFNRR